MQISFKNVLQEAIKYHVILYTNTLLHIVSVFTVTKLKWYIKHLCYKDAVIEENEC